MALSSLIGGGLLAILLLGLGLSLLARGHLRVLKGLLLSRPLWDRPCLVA